jgi:hypothetical protein
MARLAARLSTALERRISITDLYQHPTIAAQAEFLSGETSGLQRVAEADSRAHKRRDFLSARAAARVHEG